MLSTRHRPSAAPPAAAPPRRNPRISIAVRRRHIFSSLAVAFAITGLVGLIPGARGAWWATAAVSVLAIAYFGLLSRVLFLAGRREWDIAEASAVDGWHWNEWEGRLGDAVSPTRTEDDLPSSAVGLEPWALARFALSYALGWILTPAVAIAEQIAGGARADSRRQRWLERLVRLQTYGRQQSVKALSVSMVATAGVATIGSLGGVATASPGLHTSAFSATALSGSALGAAGLAAAGSPASDRYTVAPGDTLASIATRFGTTVSALAGANGIADPNFILVGQVLVVHGPPATTGSASAASGRVAKATGGDYTVVAGDTLASIAAHYGTTVSALAGVNGITDPNFILVGQVLRIGAGGASTPATAPPRSAPAGNYRVVAGDTLGAIAARFGTTTGALAAANHLANPNLVYVGQVLTISTSSSSATTRAPATPTSTPTRISTPTPTSTPAPTSAAAVAVRVALAQVGKPYVYGGAGPSSFDCSGLVMYAYAAAGVALPHYTVSQYDDTARVSETQLEAGDLVFYDTGSGAQPGHVTMYVGGGQVVSANRPGTSVQTQSIGYDGTILGFGRVG